MTRATTPDGARGVHHRLEALLEQVLEGEREPSARMLLEELGAAVEELRVADEELRVQSDQLAASAVAIDRERERYVELFEFAPDAYIETDVMGKVIEANQAASRLLGVPVRQVAGKLLVTFVHPDERRAFRSLLSDVDAGAEPGEVVLRMSSRHGREVVAGVQAARYQEPDLSLTRIRWLVRDITARARLEDRVEALAGEVEMLTDLGEVQRLVAGADPLAATLGHIVELAQRTLPGCQVGVTLVGRSDVEHALSGGPRAEELEARQREAGEGPCIEALCTGEVVRSAPERWPALADATDVREIIGVPVMRGTAASGALDVYVIDADLDERDLHLLLLLAGQAAVALENAELFASSRALAGGLSRALDTRGVIERAKGVLMARDGCTEDVAFDVLRRASQRENVKLRDVAARVVAGLPVGDAAGP